MLYPYYETSPFSIYTSHIKRTYNFPSHFHNCLEIAYCISGMQNIKIGKTVYTLKKGDAILIFPNTVHEYLENDSGSKVHTEILALICSTKLLSEVFPDTVTKYPENPIIHSEKITHDTIYALGKITATSDTAELLGWTYIALSNLMRSIELIPLEGNTELPSKIISYIDANFREELTINRIAAEFGYHPSYIAHLFCDRLKISFRTYLGAVRSQHAAAQICSTEKSLTEIAFDCGYNSLNTFCRCFKKHYSKTPSQYKKAHRLHRKTRQQMVNL